MTIPPKGAIRSSILLVAALSGPIVIGTPSPAPASTSTTIVATDVAAQAGIAQTTPTWSAPVADVNNETRTTRVGGLEPLPRWRERL